MAFSFGVASSLAYPFYYCREMVDLWPKERGGHCTWKNSYAENIKWQIENMDVLGYNFFTNYWQWMRRYGFTAFIALWTADNLGMMTNNSESFNSLETMFPSYVESS